MCCIEIASVVVIQSLQDEASALREQLVAVLEQALFGDSLAAEYLLCHLISSM